MRLNAAKFRLNGSCGYVLKPEYMRGVGRNPPKILRKLKVAVILGSQLPKPANRSSGEIIDPDVVVSIRGITEDTASQQTRVIDNNGFSPYWNQTFEFTISNFEMAMLTLRVYDQGVLLNTEIAEGAFPLPSLRLGYRSVPLYLTSNGHCLEHSTLLCHFTIV